MIVYFVFDINNQLYVSLLFSARMMQITHGCVSILRANLHVYACKIYLVDPASSYMLVSKIKPCMSLYIPWIGKTANGSLNQLSFLRLSLKYKDNCSNSRANTCQLCLDLTVRAALLEQNQPASGR